MWPFLPHHQTSFPHHTFQISAYNHELRINIYNINYMKRIFSTLLLFIIVMTATKATAQNEGKGDGYTYRQYKNTYVASVDNHREVASTLERVCNDLQITGGDIIGIGAVNQATLRCFNPATKEYVDKTFAEQMEIANLTGNVGVLNGKIYLHLHITLGKTDYTALAGHLLRATLNGAGEFVINKYPGELSRYHNEQIGLNMYRFCLGAPER